MIEGMTGWSAVLVGTDETPVVEAEEEVWEKDLSARLSIEDARRAYQAGQFVTIDEYLKTNGCIVC